MMHYTVSSLIQPRSTRTPSRYILSLRYVTKVSDLNRAVALVFLQEAVVFCGSVYK
jgi:hypothetical protein